MLHISHTIDKFNKRPDNNEDEWTVGWLVALYRVSTIAKLSSAKNLFMYIN